jgi:transposase
MVRPTRPRCALSYGCCEHDGPADGHTYLDGAAEAAAGVTDMRAGMNGLAVKVQTTLAEEPLSGHVFVFRGGRGNVVKVLWANSDGLCLPAQAA